MDKTEIVVNDIEELVNLIMEIPENTILEVDLEEGDDDDAGERL